MSLNKPSSSKSFSKKKKQPIVLEIESRHRRVFEKNLSNFSAGTKNSLRLYSVLHATGIISDEEILTLQNESSTPRILYELMMSRDDEEVLRPFIEALDLTGNEHIAHEIETGLIETPESSIDSQVDQESRLLIEKIFEPIEKIKSLRERSSKTLMDLSSLDGHQTYFVLKDLWITKKNPAEDSIFPVLESLTLVRCRIDDKIFTSSKIKDLFPALKVLIINNCTNLRGFPLVTTKVAQGIESLPALTAYVIDGCNINYSRRYDCLERIDKHYIGIFIGLTFTALFFWIIGLTEVFGFGLCKCPINDIINDNEFSNGTTTDYFDQGNISSTTISSNSNVII